MTEAQKDLYLKILDSQVLHDDIHELLKKFKDTNRDLIRLSGNKSDLIKNLIEAVENEIIDLQYVQALVKDSEEFGDQYIYLYKTINLEFNAHYNNGKKIADKLFPPHTVNKFPKLMQLPTKLDWVDFRFPNRGVENSWLIKLYDNKVREVKENDNFDLNSGIRTVTYKKEESRLVYIIDWDGKGELELKISRTTFDSVKSLKQSLGQIQKLIYGVDGVVNVPGNFTKIDLANSLNNFISNSEINKKIYTLISANLIDSQLGMASIRAYDDHGESDLLSENSRKGVIEAYINGNGKAVGVVIKFLAEGSNGALKNDVNIVIGRDDINQIIIPAKIKPQEYKYVRRKIAELI